MLIYHPDTIEYMGQAYAMFACKATKDTISKELPIVVNICKEYRNSTNPFPDIQLSLYNTSDFSSEDSELAGIISNANRQGRNYTIEAALDGETNMRTANELVAIMNLAYNSSQLFAPEEDFNKEIAYKDGRNYRFME